MIQTTDISQIANLIHLQEKSFYIFIKDFVLDEEGWEALNNLTRNDHVYILSGIIRDFLTGDFDGARDFDCVLLRGNIKNAEVIHYLRESAYSLNSFGWRAVCRLCFRCRYQRCCYHRGYVIRVYRQDCQEAGL